MQCRSTLLNLADRTRNFLTKLTPLDDGGRYFHRLALRESKRFVREVLDGRARLEPDIGLESF
jgi:hypothetical protein